jgi:hypothetical protein
LLELLDAPDRQRQLGLAEVHVSLATLEEVFLTVVKQVGIPGCFSAIEAYKSYDTGSSQHIAPMTVLHV